MRRPEITEAFPGELDRDLPLGELRGLRTGGAAGELRGDSPRVRAVETGTLADSEAHDLESDGVMSLETGLGKRLVGDRGRNHDLVPGRTALLTSRPRVGHVARDAHIGVDRDPNAGVAERRKNVVLETVARELARVPGTSGIVRDLIGEDLKSGRTRRGHAGAEDLEMAGTGGIRVRGRGNDGSLGDPGLHPGREMLGLARVDGPALGRRLPRVTAVQRLASRGQVLRIRLIPKDSRQDLGDGLEELGTLRRTESRRGNERRRGTVGGQSADRRVQSEGIETGSGMLLSLL